MLHLKDIINERVEGEYMYHFTGIENLKCILKDDVLIGGADGPFAKELSISTARNRSKDIGYPAGMLDKPKDICCIVLDKRKIRAKYKVIQVDITKGKTFDRKENWHDPSLYVFNPANFEYEDRIMLGNDKCIENIRKYIVEIRGTLPNRKLTMLCETYKIPLKKL